jgi:hypothetical protein
MGPIKKQNTEAKSEKQENNKTANKKQAKKTKNKSKRNQSPTSQFQNQDLKKTKTSIMMIHRLLTKLQFGSKTFLTFAEKVHVVLQVILIMIKSLGMI